MPSAATRHPREVRGVYKCLAEGAFDYHQRFSGLDGSDRSRAISQDTTVRGARNRHDFSVSAWLVALPDITILRRERRQNIKLRRCDN